MQQWEYKVINTHADGVPLGKGKNHADQVASGLNGLGSQGWQLCVSAGSLMIFRRPSPHPLTAWAIEIKRFLADSMFDGNKPDIEMSKITKKKLCKILGELDGVINSIGE